MRVFIPTCNQDRVREVMTRAMWARLGSVMYAYWFDEIRTDEQRLGFLVSDKPLPELGAVARDFQF